MLLAAHHGRRDLEARIRALPNTAELRSHDEACDGVDRAPGRRYLGCRARRARPRTAPTEQASAVVSLLELGQEGEGGEHRDRAEHHRSATPRLLAARRRARRRWTTDDGDGWFLRGFIGTTSGCRTRRR